MIEKVLEYFSNLWYHKFRVHGLDNGDGVMINDKITVYDIANFFSSKETMSHKKLQKLTYYAYAWYIALYNDSSDNITNRLFDNCSFEAWVHGPVCRCLYSKYSDNYGMVNKYKGKINNLISGEIKQFLDSVYKTFGKYTGDELESMTHQELPWRNARHDLAPSVASCRTISESDMFTYYNSLV